ncbi:MAG: acyl-CoA thioesterase domain-containing protein [Pseudomonas sp.]|uniref:acyl-CoA thioesterase n=1 Tax=Pseudomonas sp. TaxID=306 RepID=UPI003981FE67
MPNKSTADSQEAEIDKTLVMEPPPPTLEQLLSLDQMTRNQFSCAQHQTNRNNTLYGGQLIGQALAATQATVANLRPHTMQLCFQSPSSASKAVRYRVEDTLDSRSFSTRSVVALQDATILQGIASFCGEEPGYEHAQAWHAEPPQPETLPTLEQLMRDYGARVGEHGSGRLRCYPQIDVRPIDAEQHLLLTPGPACCRFWIRALLPADANDALRYAALAFLSDYLLVNAALIPHVTQLPARRLFVASLNHTLRFHQPCDPSDWLLYETHSPWAHGGRALIQGRFYTRNGMLIASTAQEALIRQMAK